MSCCCSSSCDKKTEFATALSFCKSVPGYLEQQNNNNGARIQTTKSVQPYRAAAHLIPTSTKFSESTKQELFMYLLVGKLAGTVDGLHGTRVAPPKLTHLSGYVLYSTLQNCYFQVPAGTSGFAPVRNCNITKFRQSTYSPDACCNNIFIR